LLPTALESALTCPAVVETLFSAAICVNFSLALAAAEVVISSITSFVLMT
jgi:hypothetical protein